MEAVPTLPLAREALPESLRRFGDPAAPEKARAMAARGAVPLKGGDLVALLLQLAADPAPEVSETAQKTLAELPVEVLASAARSPMPAAFLDALAARLGERADVVEAVAVNPATADVTVARIARLCGERISESIALNEQRLLGAPEIIEALYKNRNVRSSTVDRLVELAARHGVELTGVHTYAAHVEAIRGQLVPEPSAEPLPGDEILVQALDADGDDDALETDVVEGTEEVKEKYMPLSMQIGSMNLQEKLRLTLIGNAAARALLVRDSNRIVAMAAISAPTVTDSEAVGIANSRQVSEDILRFVGNKRDWLSNYEVKRGLVFNPKTPIGISMKFLSHLHAADLKTLARSRGIPAALKTAATNRVAQKGS